MGWRRCFVEPHNFGKGVGRALIDCLGAGGSVGGPCSALAPRSLRLRTSQSVSKEVLTICRICSCVYCKRRPIKKGLAAGKAR